MTRFLYFFLFSAFLITASCDEQAKTCSRNDRLRSQCFIPGLEKLYDTISFGKYRIWLDTEDDTVFQKAKDISSWNLSTPDSSELYCLKGGLFTNDTNQCRLPGIIERKYDSIYFQLKTGELLRFKTSISFSADTLLYAYAGYLPGKKWFVFNQMYYEQDLCELINRNTGQRLTIHNSPVVSPKVEWFISGGSNFLSPGGFQLFALSADSIYPVFDTDFIDHESQMNIKWVAANEALLEYSVGVNHRYARLVIKEN
ncbi:MAG: hypothetical protein ACK5Z2_17125 [Bacteroidota bacterium]|jgi:hypothetical protein